MKNKEFEAIGKRLLPYLPGFTVCGNMLFIRPVGHTLRAIMFDRSIDPRGFYVQVFLEPLFVPTNVIGFNIGWRVGGGSHTWNADDPNLVAELGTALKREAFPFLSGAQTPSDVARAASSLKLSGDFYVQQAVAYALARAGNAEGAAAALEQLVRLLDTPVKPGWQHEMIDRAMSLKAKVADDPPAAQRQLDEWEAESAHAL